MTSLLVVKGLEELLKRINRELAVVEARLQKMATSLGLKDWRELEEIFKTKGIDNPELDMLWPKYLYLKERLEQLRKRREAVLRELEGEKS